MISSIYIPALAVAVAVTAAVVDVKERRIPNKLTYPVMLCGIAMQLAINGWWGIVSALAGALLFGGIFLLFHVVNAMGAGDVKLATALGCVVGVSSSVQLMFATALAGGVLAIVYMVRAGRVLQTVRNTLSIAGFHARHGLQEHPVVNLNNSDSVRMPYGLAFAAGTIMWVCSSMWWR